MKRKAFGAPLCALAIAFSCAAAADDAARFAPASFTTFALTPYAIEGLTGDGAGNLYTTGRAPLGEPCPVWRFDAESGARTTVGELANAPTACNPSGIAF